MVSFFMPRNTRISRLSETALCISRPVVPICRTAVSADDHPGKGAAAFMPFTAGFSSLHNALNLVPGSRLNDSRVTILHIILRHFAFVLFLLLGKKIRGEFLLKPSITLVFHGAIHLGKRLLMENWK